MSQKYFLIWIKIIYENINCVTNGCLVIFLRSNHTSAQRLACGNLFPRALPVLSTILIENPTIGVILVISLCACQFTSRSLLYKENIIILTERAFYLDQHSGPKIFGGKKFLGTMFLFLTVTIIQAGQILPG